MHKQSLSRFALFFTLMATMSPAWADDRSSKSPAVISPAVTNPAASSLAITTPPASAVTPVSTPTANAADSKGVGARLASWPVCIAGFACGTIVGTPICFFRKLPSEIHNLAYGFVGSITDNQSKYLLIPAGIAWLPFSGTAALMEAPVYAFKDAYMAEKPFSKEQFSLGQIDAPDKK